MHFTERSLDAEIFLCGVGMGCHDAYNRRISRIISRCNDPENNVLACEDSGDTFTVHDEHRRRMILAHQPCCLADGGADVDEDRGWSRFEDCGEVWAGHFGAEVGEVLQHLLGLGDCCAPFCLYALEGFVEFLGRSVGSFKLKSISFQGNGGTFSMAS